MLILLLSLKSWAEQMLKKTNKRFRKTICFNAMDEFRIWWFFHYIQYRLERLIFHEKQLQSMSLFQIAYW